MRAVDVGKKLSALARADRPAADKERDAEHIIAAYVRAKGTLSGARLAEKLAKLDRLVVGTEPRSLLQDGLRRAGVLSPGGAGAAAAAVAPAARPGTTAKATPDGIRGRFGQARAAPAAGPGAALDVMAPLRRVSARGAGASWLAAAEAAVAAHLEGDVAAGYALLDGALRAAGADGGPEPTGRDAADLAACGRAMMASDLRAPGGWPGEAGGPGPGALAAAG